MLLVHVRFLILDHGQLPHRSFYRGLSVPLTAPSVDIIAHFHNPPLLLVDVVAQLAPILLFDGCEDKLQATCLACSVFFIALLLELAPSPIAARPACLPEVTHCFCRSLPPSPTQLMEKGAVLLW